MVDGGFCSVLAKYAMGKCFEKKSGYNVKYDLSWFSKSGVDCDGKFKRTFQLLKVFPKITFKIATPGEVALYKKYFYYAIEQTFVYDESLYTKHVPLYVDGYLDHWKNYDLIKDELLEDLDFGALELDSKNKKWLAEINSEPNSVAVHVRRGDYINLGHCILTPEYYISSIEHVVNACKEESPHFFFFSNGMDWVKDNMVDKIPKDIKYSFVEANDNDTGYIDLYLISQCKHQISSNSSFGVWGGLLNRNKNKIVIIPDRWYGKSNAFNKGSETANRFPGWLVLPCEGRAAKT